MAGHDRLLLRAFWRELPNRSLAVLAGAVFFTFASVGFLIDIMSRGRLSAGTLAYTVFFSGALAVVYVFTVARRPAWLPAVVGVHLLIALLGPSSGRAVGEQRAGMVLTRRDAHVSLAW